MSREAAWFLAFTILFFIVPGRLALTLAVLTFPLALVWGRDKLRREE